MKYVLTILVCLAGGWAARANSTNVKWELKFTENFDGKALNGKLWSRINGNPEGSDWQKHILDREDLAEVKGGELWLKGIKNEDRTSDPRPILAGGVTTKDKLAIKYGKIEVRVKLESCQGAWPAIWMLPQEGGRGWPAGGEIDIFERVNHDPFVYQTIHSTWKQSNPSDPPYSGRGDFKPDDWNIFAFEWTPDKLVWKVNGKTTHTYPKTQDNLDQWPFQVPFYLMLDMQLGGAWAGAVDETGLPIAMRIDWVKIYQLKIGGKKVSEFKRPKK